MRKKTAQIEAQIVERQEKGLVRNPALETAFKDIENLRDSLQQSTESLFNISVYITLYADSLDELNKLEGQISNLLESRLIYNKGATFQQLEAFNSVLPLANDQLEISSPMNSSPAASFFPFVSPSLTSDNGFVARH